MSGGVSHENKKGTKNSEEGEVTSKAQPDEEAFDPGDKARQG